MESKIGRVALGVVAVAAAVVLLVLLSSSDDSDGGDAGGGAADTTASAQNGKPSDAGKGADGRKPTLPTILVRDGKPVGGIEKLEYDAGDMVRFVVRSDTPDELHVHGYDIERELPAGRTVRVQFPASIEGIFEAELHGSGEQIAELQVNL
jgi:hypothetical protein